jgi:hypothetical protein
MIYLLKTNENYLDKTLGRSAKRMGERYWKEEK